MFAVLCCVSLLIWLSFKFNTHTFVLYLCYMENLILEFLKKETKNKKQKILHSLVNKFN